MKWELKSYKFICVQCGKEHERVCKKTPKVCLDCRKMNLIKAQKNTGRLVKKEKELDAKMIKELATESEVLKFEMFLKELRNPYFASRFV